MGQRRRLTDLWIVGKEVRLEDGDNFEEVWIQKLNPVEMADAARRADAIRARQLAMKNLANEDDYQAQMSAVLDYGDEPGRLIDYLISEDRSRSLRRHAAEMGADEEWSKSNYLEGLRDAWGTLEATLASNPEDIEASRVGAELKRFNDEVDDMVEDDMAVLKDTMMSLPMDELRDRMVKRLIEFQANSTWLEEFYRCQLWFGVRQKDNHKQRYFESREEVDGLAVAAFRLLREHYESLEVESVEGKDSPAPAPSSTSSEPAASAAMEPSSGLVSAAV